MQPGGRFHRNSSRVYILTRELWRSIWEEGSQTLWDRPLHCSHTVRQKLLRVSAISSCSKNWTSLSLCVRPAGSRWICLSLFQTAQSMIVCTGSLFTSSPQSGQPTVRRSVKKPRIVRNIVTGCVSQPSAKGSITIKAKGSIILKAHHLWHYPEQVLQFGSLEVSNTVRLERAHQLHKNAVKPSKNRRAPDFSITKSYVRQ